MTDEEKKGVEEKSSEQSKHVQDVIDVVEKGVINGVEIELIERIIIIMRDYYPVARDASGYYQKKTRSYNVVGITNLRDVTSHIATICRSDIGLKEKNESLHQLEEHLRRAIVESYELVVQFYSKQFLTDYQEYEKRILPKERLAGTHKMTNHHEIRERIKAVVQLFEEGKKKKDGNIWNRDWEDGVKKLVVAAELLEELIEQLKQYKEAYYQNMYTRKLFFWGAIFSMIVAFLFSSYLQVILKYFRG